MSMFSSTHCLDWLIMNPLCGCNQITKQTGLDWMIAAVNVIPDVSATVADRAKLLNVASTIVSQEAEIGGFG